VAAREESQTKYEGLDPSQAAKLAGEVFPGTIDRPAGTLPQLPAGQQVVGYPADNAAQVDLGGGKHGVIESMEPIAIETSQGHREPLDLGLEEANGAFHPSRSDVAVRIPKQLADGVQLVSTGVSLTPVDASGSALGGSEGTVDGATVLYANTQTDTDTVVKPLTSGFEEDALLRSVNSPQQLSFRLGLPEGATLRQATAGSGPVEIVEEGQVLALVPSPSAEDAAGTPVPVSMSVTGDILTLSVDEHAGEYELPIDVDPTVEDKGRAILGENWGFYTENASIFEGYGGEGGLGDKVSKSVKAGERAFFYYATQGESRIYAVNSDSAFSGYGGNKMENVLGIENVHSGVTEASKSWIEDYDAEETLCALSGCATGTVTSSNDKGEIFYQQDSRETNEWGGGTASLYDAYADILQETGPSASFETSVSKVGGYTNALYGNKWVRSNDNPLILEVNATDPGIGIYSSKWTSKTDSEWDPFGSEGSQLGCVGVQCEECLSSSCGDEPLWTHQLETLPEGEDEVEDTVKDAVGLSATAKATVKIDNVPPHNITLSGLPPWNEIAFGYYKFKVSATDGSGTTRSSGVASITVSIDGKEVGKPNGSCSPGPCTATGEWTVNGEEYAAGKHKIVMTATDAAGNVAKEEATLTIHAAESKPAGPGSVELASGAFTLSATDASVSSFGGGLSVERSFNSRRVSAGVEGPFGTQWQGLSFGGNESLTKLPTGGVVFAATNGMQSLFTKEGSKFLPPAGDSNLTLKEESASVYTLTDQHDDVTTFTVPIGGSGTLLTPSAREEAGHTGSIKYTFQTVSGITEPTEALAPVPAGVSCTTLVKGCRALTFSYASSTTATGEAPTEWGEYKGRLTKISFTAYNPTSKEMQTTAVAQYSYDKQGRLRAEWNPQISPALKTIYGYDAEGHITAVTDPGQQPWLLHYGTIENDPSGGRLLSVTRPGATTAFGEDIAPASTEAPKLSTTSPVEGKELTVSNGVWSHSPLSYGYQWERCNSSGAECSIMAGAVNSGYTPRYGDEGHTLVVLVMATNAGGSTTVATAASSVVPENVFPPTYSTSFGSAGTTEGKFKSPSYDAVSEVKGETEKLYVTDTGNNRVEVFNLSGGYLSEFGSTGTEDGEFKEPTGIMTIPAVEKGYRGYEWIADSGNKRIDEYGGSHLYSSAASESAGALGGMSGNYVGGVDAANSYVARNGAYPFQLLQWYPTKLYVSEQYGEVGKGKGQVKEPADLVWDYVAESMYIADTGNNRVQEEESGNSFGEAGSKAGQFKEPKGIATDSYGNLWVVDTGNDRVEGFTSAGKFITEIGTKGEGAAQFKEPIGIAIDGSNNLYVVDRGNNRVEKWLAGKRPAEQSLPPAKPPTPGTSAVETIEYQVPLSGSAAPDQLSSTETAKWGETDNPVEATAIFPPDEPMGWPAKDYKRATVYYRDSKDRTVNTAAPSGAISTAEYNTSNDVVRTLSPDNRSAAFKEGSKSAEASKLLDTESTYNSEGTELQSTLGPQHPVKLASGSTVEARDHQLYYYEEGAPTEGGPYRLVTTTTQSAEIKGYEEEEDVRTTKTSYSGQSNLGWKLRKPTSVTAEPSGLKLTHTTLYEASTGNVTETRMPASPGENSAHDTQTIYYTTAANSKYPGCGEHAEWANLVCQTQPAKQPETSGLPNLPVTTYTYNIWDEPEKTTETVGSTTRTKTATYEASGRLEKSAISSTVGTALPTVVDAYNKETGALEKQSTTTEGKTKTITSVFNSLAELTSYTDAGENTSTYEYDIDGRVKTVNDGKGIETYTYSTTTGLPTELVSEYGTTKLTFTASYDPEGNLLTAGYPNGMNANYTYNQVGKPIALEYVKTTDCIEKCTWFSDSVVPSIHGQWLEQTSTLSHQAYTYDGAGRLTQVQNTPTGKGCTTRIYAYEEDTNRTSLTTREPNSKGECATEGGTVEKHTYDTADRLTDTGIKYSEFGNITNLPAADAGGSEATSTFYTDNQLAGQTQNGQTIGYNLDPAGRTLETVSTGKRTSDITNHYAGPGSTPAWSVNTAGEYTRNISGLTGFAAVQNNTEAPVLQLTNLHGDIIATAYLSETATALASTADTSEFGVPTTSLPPKYSWLGADEIPTELPSGILDMGARSYIPQLGRFLQPDPRPDGSANAYTYTFGDPVNSSDPSGEYTIGGPSEALINSTAGEASQAAAQQAAENAAARAEAERKAAEAAAQFAHTLAVDDGEISSGEEEWGEEEEWWEEEEGEYEYASYHPHAESGKEETHIEDGVLYQALPEAAAGGDEAPAYGGSAAVPLCSTRAHSQAQSENGQVQGQPCGRDAFLGIHIHVGHLVHSAEHFYDTVGRYVVRGITESIKATGASFNTIRQGLETGVRGYFEDGGPPP
jgi:RHS repeat-associated protein